MKALIWMGLAAILMIPLGMAQDAEALRRERDVLLERGLWKDAVTFYKEKLSPISDAESGKDLEKAISADERLDGDGSVDQLVEDAVASHPENPEVLLSAAGVFSITDFNSLLPPISNRHGSAYRDRTRALQLILASLKHATADPLKIRAWQALADRLFQHESWKLQILTPLDVLPGVDDLGPMGGTEGAPWSKDGPALYAVPASWEAAKNDGERWRFALAQLSKLGPASDAVAKLKRARFSESEFGAQTLSDFGWRGNNDPESEKGILALETLADDEVLAKTSDGVRRFKLPDDQHFIALYRSIIDVPEVGGDAGYSLAQVYLGRRQFTKAREVLDQVIAKYGTGPGDSRKNLLDQIAGNWGRFEAPATVPAGKRPMLPLIFRNAKAAKFTASPMDVDGLLEDTISYLKSNPRDLEWDRINPSAIASRIVSEKQSKYVGAPAAEWAKELKPEDGHRDKREEIEMPLDIAGAWWISAEMENGNTFHTVVWIVDTVLVHRDVAGSKQWWVADAESGAPVAGAELELFGYEMVNRERKTPLERRMDVHTAAVTKTTDDDGKTLIKPEDIEANHQWMAIARKPGRATAFFGFQPFSIEEPRFENGNRDIGYGITDRPLYKPGDTLHAKFFMRNVGYFEPNEAKYANLIGTLSLYNGRGEEALKIPDLRTDEFGAAEADMVIPKDAPLGSWRCVFSIPDVNAASVSFQVEEFRKPEYEVSVEAPAEPVKLGDKFNATVKATYFHGAPVREAEVEVIVKRSTLSDRWFPLGKWDWLYGPGAWWPGTDTAWHPGWNEWGCKPPDRGWGDRTDRWSSEEIVLRKTLKIGADGTVKIEIDTADAKRVHGDLDSTYAIEARVVDASRREETASGNVIAARKPFEIVVWTDRGYAAPGTDLEALISVSTLARKPVASAEGTLKLFKLSVAEDGKVSETEVSSWPVKSDANGNVSQRFAAPAAGQYRIAARLSWNGGETVEGATILNVHGQGRADSADWKFGPIELITDRLQYAAGDTLKLRVNGDKPDAHVWLFLHVGGASGLEARRIKLDGKSLEVDVPLDRRDMPNMFIEGVTVHGAKIFSASKEVLLPPESKMIDVTVTASQTKIGPKGKSSLRIALKDSEGKPVAGKAVLAVYDKALEAITGGSNVPPIHEGFWNWKNEYYGGRSSCSVPMSPGNLVEPRMLEMETLGGISAGMSRGAVFSSMDDRSMKYAEASAPASPSMAAGPAADSFSAPVAIQVRKDFADLLKWVGTVATDADGNAEVPLEFPDNLTTWKARVWVLGSGTRVGEGSTEMITAKDLMVRLEAPRFLVERDEAILSAVVHNDHETAKSVTISLELEGGELSAKDAKPSTVEIPARGEARVDWPVKAVREGIADVRMTARTDGDGDAVERELPVKVHGMLRQDAWSRVIAEEEASAKIAIEEIGRAHV